LSLVMFDLDGFQEINDQHGTAAGDAVLARFVQVCRELLRTEDILGRYWADKFVCLLPLTDVASAETVADRIRAKIAITPVEAGDHRITTSASGGLVTRQDADRSLDTLLRRAERALQHAKGHGGDRITVER
jgi:diguanylate cyclase (GGDEF)-like protein